VWLARQIATPDEMLVAKDPIATVLFKKYKKVNMPNLRLDQDEVRLIIDFLKDPSQTAQSNDPSKSKSFDLVGSHGH
jgi:hypothetical protein